MLVLKKLDKQDIINNPAKYAYMYELLIQAFPDGLLENAVIRHYDTESTIDYYVDYDGVFGALCLEDVHAYYTYEKIPDGK